MISVLDFGSRDLRGQDLAGSIFLCPWAKPFTLSVPNSPPGVQMGTGELSGKPDKMLGGGGPWSGITSYPKGE